MTEGQVAAVQTTMIPSSAPKSPEGGAVTVHGAAGDPFSIDGPGLGSGGALTISGVEILTTRWDDRRIKGVLPRDLQPGEVVLTTKDGVVRRGKFPYSTVKK